MTSPLTDAQIDLLVTGLIKLGPKKPRLWDDPTTWARTLMRRAFWLGYDEGFRDCTNKVQSVPVSIHELDKIKQDLANLKHQNRVLEENIEVLFMVTSHSWRQRVTGLVKYILFWR
jgi:hypothetical protein